jgi:hypothetical protein
VSDPYDPDERFSLYPLEGEDALRELVEAGDGEAVEEPGEGGEDE